MGGVADERNYTVSAVWLVGVCDSDYPGNNDATILSIHEDRKGGISSLTILPRERWPIKQSCPVVTIEVRRSFGLEG